MHRTHRPTVAPLAAVSPARLLAFGLAVLPAAPAWAHAVLERKEASPDAAYRGVVQITHGCAGSPTTRVTVTIPEGVVGAKPMPKPGWQVTTTKGAYARAYSYYHGPIREGVKTITWSGGSLPDDHVDEFTFLARVSDAFAPGDTVYVPVEQVCEAGRVDWSEIPAPGTSAHALKAPAPGLRIVAAAAPSPASDSARSVTAGALRIAQPWSRATPSGAAVAGGYVTITNTGSEPDRLTGVALDAAGRGEIHTMSDEGGVMRMAPLPAGLEIRPGETITLKPGGYHLMFLDLKAPLKKGEPVKGSLRFERAGTVQVEFAVEGIGAQRPPAPAGGQAHEHAH